MSFDLKCWLAGHIPEQRYTSMRDEVFISNCARCGSLILKRKNRRWVPVPHR